MTKEEDQKICDLLRSRNKKGLDLLFQVYYTSLVLWANTFLNSLPAAEDLVQEFFITVWKDRFYEKFQAHHLSSFLRIVVKNRALNKLEKRDVLQSVTGLEHIELAWEEYNDPARSDCQCCPEGNFIITSPEPGNNAFGISAGNEVSGSCEAVEYLFVYGKKSCREVCRKIERAFK